MQYLPMLNGLGCTALTKVSYQEMGLLSQLEVEIPRS